MEGGRRKMDFIDLKTQQERIKEQIHVRIGRVLDHGQYIMGPEIRELEEKLAAYVGAKHAVGCASGTDALFLALMAYGVGRGDAVITTPFTFVATAEVIALVGATPVFVDIDPRTYNIDPVKIEQAVQALQDCDRNIHPLPSVVDGPSPLNLRGIIAVDLFGLPADYDTIGAIAKKNDLFVIEDAAQSFGADYKGRKACSLGHIACTSFFPAKPLGCYGDGGMCFTDEDNLAAILDSLRLHGKGVHKYDNVRIGINGRLDTLQAAILLAKFGIFPEEVQRRQAVAEGYTELLAHRNDLVKPCVPKGYLSVWAQYSLLAEDEEKRARILRSFEVAGIPTAIYYPVPLHLQGAFAYLGYRRGDFPVSEGLARRIFSIPMHPYLSKEEQEKIVTSLPL